ncbi:hypothetical protein EV714DRAFT_272340 [Schizophyllum commune]
MTGACYCAVCDDYFYDDEDRNLHIQQSIKHPYCAPCDRRFLNLNVYRKHLQYSRIHNYCTLCEMEFRTPAGLRCHYEKAPPHCDDSDDEAELDEEDDYEEGWEDRVGLDLYPEEPYPEEDADGGDHSWMDSNEDDLLDFDSDDEDEHEDEDSEVGEDEATVSSFACPMCKEAPELACLTRCGHLYCATCIHHAYKRDNKCPTCREEGQTSQLRKVYLTTETDDY